MEAVSFPERAAAIRRAAALLCLRLGWAPLHEVPLPNGRRADILALLPDGGFACIEVKSGPRDFLTDQKWPEYRDFSDLLFFAVDADFPLALLPGETGLIVTAGLEADLLRDAPPHRLPAPRRRRVCNGSRCWPPGGWRWRRTRTGRPRFGRHCGSNSGAGSATTAWDTGACPVRVRPSNRARLLF